MKQRFHACVLVMCLASCSHKPLSPVSARNQVTLAATFEAHRPVRVSTVLRVESDMTVMGKPAHLWDETTLVQQLCPLTSGVSGRDALEIRFSTLDWAYREDKLDGEVQCSAARRTDERCAQHALAMSVAWTARVARDLTVTSDAITYDRSLLDQERAAGRTPDLVVAPSTLNAAASSLLHSFTRGTHKVGDAWDMPRVGLLIGPAGESTERWVLTAVDGTTAHLSRPPMEKLPPGWKSATRQTHATANAVTGWLQTTDEELSYESEGADGVRGHIKSAQRVEVMGPDQRCP